MKITETAKKQTITNLKTIFGDSVSRKELISHFKNTNQSVPNWLVNGSTYRLQKGIINLTGDQVKKASILNRQNENIAISMQAQIVNLKQKKMITEVGDLVPIKDDTYVPFGFYKDLESIVKSKVFYPLFVTGLTGNGKTTMVEQVCAKLKRECIRVNISIETDEDDLVGGSTLIDGNVTFREGPVITAMRRGAILLIDEIDRGSNKLMCIQGILEGKPYFVKKTGEVITASAGFNIIATANTKGRGTDDGKYIAAQILDEAFLERFPITVEQEYPSAIIERKIIINNMQTLDCIDEDFADKLVGWAEIIRKTYVENAIDEIISTRRLVHIVKAFSVFKDRQKAINLCINRFDSDTKDAFLDLYQKMDMPLDAETNPPPKEDTPGIEDIPF
ncbi:MAG: AAA family ATPase [Proteobacteria bacterium]|nr:AAA family ATPase [Pseudomonadota bacterium]NBP14481.1 AAA family ATPase [bacterium]